jgi:rRNA maturation RNase YbeY
MAIQFNSDIGFTLKSARRHREWISKIIRTLKKREGEIVFQFTSDEELGKLNVEYLRHNSFTDILTFDYSENKTLSGDILISVDRVKENAIKFRTGFDEELRRVMIHGVLHLAGYRDKTKKEIEEMRMMEKKAIKRY